MKIIPVIILIGLILVMVMPVSTSNVTASRSCTAKGPYNLLIPLGIEQAPGMTLGTALMFYNWISVCLLFFAMGMASQRNMRFFVIIIPLLAAMFAYFGWLNDPDTIKTWSIIGLTGIISAGIYMKDTNKEKWGSGGPGLTLFNFVFFMILLQGAVGVVNTTGIWEHNLAPTPTEFQNVDLGAVLPGISNTGGFLDGAITTAVALLEMGIMLLKMIVSILLTIVAFSVTLYLVFPWLYGNPLVVAFIGIVQVIVWLLYAWFFFTIIFKPMPDGGYI